MFVLQTFWEDYILKNSILDWNTFSYITKQAAAWIQRILKLYFNDFYSVWSHAVCFRTSQSIFAAFHEILRAFDTVWHARLINKLKPIGIKGPLLRIIDQCYTDMKSAVFLNGATSTWFPVNCGETTTRCVANLSMQTLYWWLVKSIKKDKLWYQT